MIKITLKDPKLSALLADLEGRARKLGPAMNAIGRYQKSQVGLGFRSGVSPYGESWAPPKLRAGQPLIDSGRLRSSVTYIASHSSVTIGTNLLYGKVHQFGATIVPVHAKALMFTAGGVFYRLQKAVIPARPFLPTSGLPDKWQPRHSKILINHLNGAAKL